MPNLTLRLSEFPQWLYIWGFLELQRFYSEILFFPKLNCRIIKIWAHAIRVFLLCYIHLMASVTDHSAYLKSKQQQQHLGTWALPPQHCIQTHIHPAQGNGGRSCHHHCHPAVTGWTAGNLTSVTVGGSFPQELMQAQDRSTAARRSQIWGQDLLAVWQQC